MSSYYHSEISLFLDESDSSIIGKLASQHRHDLESQQREAWANQLKILKRELANISGHIFIEFTIPRIGKRADCIVVTGSTVFVIEFKNGASRFDKDAIDQAHDYALDLKDFHRGSHKVPIIPILVATASLEKAALVQLAQDDVANPVTTGAIGFGDLIKAHAFQHGKPQINPVIWAESGYSPTPTIIEAARSLYENKKVKDIMRSEAGATNLTLTTNKISEIIDACKRAKKKAICFVTGVPGAGKTLAGLNIATQRQEQFKEENAVFLSGNGPLVEVLREALTRDAHQRTGGKKSESERKVNAFIQNIHHFRDANFESVNAPFEHVAVFDEAQRAWNQHQVAKFMKRKRNIVDFDKSEAHFLIEVMNRHHDWCVIVCLIGGGQEIHTGEAGITEWLRPMNEHFKGWEVHASPYISHHSYIGNDTELSNFVKSNRVTKDESLHLSTSIRSFRAGTLSEFISKLLDGSAIEAKKLIETLNNYPIYATRDIRSAKEWLKSKSRGSRRSGIVASSGGARLKPDGIFVECAPDPKVWFLNGRNDVRSSYHLEIAATEFHVQGLELDWACVCWDADLRHIPGGWNYFNFKGSKWNQVRSKAEQGYLLNAYRVLLTRAREGLIIFVPKGSDSDQTTQCNYYDGIWNYLMECGITRLD